MGTTLACIGGTAAYDLLKRGAFVARRLGPQLTPFGESQPVYLCQSRGCEFLFLARHGESGFQMPTSFVNYRANIFAVKALGACAIISWSETRSITHNYNIGEYVIVDDLIDETHSRPTTFFENMGLGVLRQWPVFCPWLRQAFAGTLAADKFPFADGGAYVCVEGPRRETPAEARKYAFYGADLIGYSLAPEVFLAKELQMCYASICFVAEYAENGSDFQPFENGRILDRREQALRSGAAVERLPRILDRLCEQLTPQSKSCGCEQLMQHHIDHGHIGHDWRSWFNPGTAAPALVTGKPKSPQSAAK